MSLFAVMETCLVVITPLTFFLRKAVLALLLGVLALVFLHLACHNNVAIFVLLVALLPCVS